MPATKSRTKSTPKPSSVKPPTTTTTTPSPSKTQNPTPPLRDRLRRTPGRVNSTNNINTMETPSNTKPRRGKNIINKLIESKEETCKLNNEEDEEEAFGTPLDGDMNGELKKDGHRRFDSDDEEEQEEEELNNEDLEEQIEQEEIEIQQDIDSDSNDEIIASDSEDDEQVEALTLSDAKKALQQKQEKERVIAQQLDQERKRKRKELDEKLKSQQAEKKARMAEKDGKSKTRMLPESVLAALEEEKVDNDDEESQPLPKGIKKTDFSDLAALASASDSEEEPTRKSITAPTIIDGFSIIPLTTRTKSLSSHQRPIPQHIQDFRKSHFYGPRIRRENVLVASKKKYKDELISKAKRVGGCGNGLGVRNGLARK